eukprot:TRINITY_DN2982_c0_g1_i2.p1 TRINITY_DN2982_c0_g1~~TRINITY_DN2982_c0_g1_i2.p1  ORF type:complete len:195 (+),score=37.82 TRINITY_DN2982_c0_g1_i2:175-759(+)
MTDTVPQVEEVFDDEPEGVPVAKSVPAKIEDADEELPNLEPVQDEELNKANNKQSRSEKKSRKAVARLGLKPVPDVTLIRVKKGKSVLFVIDQPDVYKSPGDHTYVIFGEAKVDQEVLGQALSEKVGQFKEKDEIPDLIPSEPATEVVEDVEGVNLEFIQLVIDQTQCTRSAAIAALKETGNDVVNAIMKLSVQ